MKQILAYEEMSTTVGGNFWDGFCVVVTVGKIFAPVLAITGVGLVLVNAATIGCAIYKIATIE